MTYFSAPGTVKEINPEILNRIFGNPVWDKYTQKHRKRAGGHKHLLKKIATMYVLRDQYSLPKLANLFGYRTHTTVLHNVRNFKGWLDTKDEVATKALEDAKTLLFNSRIIYK